jgi:hypothetical protein
MTNKTSHFRALTLMKKLSPGQKTFRVTEDDSAPHLTKGEYAVVDTADRDLQNGELYLVQSNSGERPRNIFQTRSDMLNITGPGAEPSLVWWVGHLRGFRKTDEVVDGHIPVFAGLSDGPYETEGLQSKLIGRIIGVAFSPLDGLIAASAGYENEAAGNAAFDPAEYLDALISTGHKPSVFYDGRGLLHYCELLPQRSLRRAEHKAVWKAREKFGEASTGLDRVKQECVRRGMIDGRAVQS